MFIATAISNTLVDIAILCVPLPIVWRLKITTKQKIAVSGVFLLGAFVVGISIARVYFFYQSTPSFENALDITVNVAPTLYWTQLEASIAVICACLPTLGPLFAHFSPQAILDVLVSKFTLLSRTKTSLDQLPHNKSDVDQESLKLSNLSNVKLTNRCEAIQMDIIDTPLPMPVQHSGILVQKSIQRCENDERV
ncbi:hypothetical protein F4808DRAFT_444494 [Astrocystis sublimbata]|nr:hypothetical protein F4808DRAFT_444494 [Astrocystis sublimbata]